MSEELVTIAIYPVGAQAEMARSFLQSFGIDVFIADENTTRIANHLTPMLGGAKLQVRASDEETARELLSQAESGSGGVESS